MTLLVLPPGCSLIDRASRRLGAGLRHWVTWLPGVWLALAVLPGCATLAPPSASPGLLHDALFAHPPRPAEAGAAMALDEPMRAYLRSTLASGVQQQGKARALTDALYVRDGLRLDYDASVTRTAAQAFAARSGNCLSLVLMTAALAREMGLEVNFQSVRLDDAFSRSGDLTLRSGHVNLVIGPRPPVARWQVMNTVPDVNRLQVDFLPPDDLRGLRTQPITESTVLAMFMNNRAAEALARHQTAEAYAWVREALQTDPGFWPAVNTLGVVYQQAGHLAAAAAAFEQLLAQDSSQVAAMWNLAQVLQAQGRDAEAARWTVQRLALEPVPPYHYQQLGEMALARGAWALAREHFRSEQRITGDSPELQLGLAQAHYRLGDWGAARQALQQAINTSANAVQQARYTGKLAWLQAQGRAFLE
jgi:tetratricopeptide (TPR) repeat protein